MDTLWAYVFKCVPDEPSDSLESIWHIVMAFYKWWQGKKLSIERTSGCRMFAFILLAEIEADFLIQQSGSCVSKFFHMDTEPNKDSRELVFVAKTLLYQLRTVAKIHPQRLDCIFEEVLTPKTWENFTMHLSRKFESILVDNDYTVCEPLLNAWNKPITFFTTNKIFPLFVHIEKWMGVPTFHELQKGITPLLNEVFQRAANEHSNDLEVATKSYIVQKATKDTSAFVKQLLDTVNPVPPTGRFRSFLEHAQFQPIDAYGSACDAPKKCVSDGKHVLVCEENEYVCDHHTVT